ncbi:MAG: hypothetical protein NPINA01_02650 [Nitrospinaceae bacterium]|nr:MAG: hypothetical protein NPINA01_02650 [Nitrospinaceae bacterium]
MRNLNVICIETDVVPWPSQKSSPQLTESMENHSNGLPEGMKMDRRPLKCEKTVEPRILLNQVATVGGVSGSLDMPDHKLRDSQQKITPYSANGDNTLKRYHAEYFLN